MVNEWMRDDLATWLNDHHPKVDGDCSQSEAQEWAEVVRELRRERDAAVARAGAAEARTAPAVTVEQRNAVADHLWNAMVGSAKSVVRDVVRDAFYAAGIEVAAAPAVTKADIEKAIRSEIETHRWKTISQNVLDDLSVLIGKATDAVWSLVSGDDPAVHVVRESELPTLHPRYVRNFNLADGQTVFRDASDEDIARAVADVARDLRYVIAAHRAIEAGADVDPLLGKAQEFAALADWELTDREAELLHTVAAHVLGQEATR